MPSLRRRLLLAALPGALFGAMVAWSALTVVGLASHQRTPDWVRALDAARPPLVDWKQALLLTCGLGGWLLFATCGWREPEPEAAA